MTTKQYFELVKTQVALNHIDDPDLDIGFSYILKDIKNN